MLWAQFGWSWSSSFEEDDENVEVYDNDDNRKGQILIRKDYLSLWLSLAKNLNMLIKFSPPPVL